MGKNIMHESLIDYLEQADQLTKGPQVINFEEFNFKQVGFLGTWTESKKQHHWKSFNRYEFNAYTEKRGLMWKYLGNGVFKKYTERG